LRLADAVISETLNTGSSGLITLYNDTLDIPGVRSTLVQKGEVKSGEFQGEEKLMQEATIAHQRLRMEGWRQRLG
jgi:hypothetical protein